MTAPASGPRLRDPTARVSDVIDGLRPTRIFKTQAPDTSITSLDFDDQGEQLVTACDDETLQLYNCRDGTHTKALFSKKYGAHLARFTHHPQSILYASTKVDDTIRYLSTHNNQYIRYFQGHTAPVTCLSMSPGSDEFLSCSMDNNVRIWSLNTPNATGKLILNGAYLATYDPSATVIAVASPVCNSILLYDVRKYDKAPFASFDMVELEAGYNAKAIDAAVARTKDSDPSSHAWNPGKWATLDFSNDGKSLVLGTRSGLGHYLLDAFTGSLRAFCTLNRPSAGLEDAGNGAAPPSSTTTTTTTTMIEPTPIIRSRPRLAPGNRSSTPGGPAPAQGDVCFSPDGRYLVGGAGDQNLFVWDTQQVLQPSSSTPSSSSSLSSPMALPNGSINPDTRTVGMGGKIVDDDHDHHMDDADDNHGYVKGNHHNDNTAVASGGGNNRTPLLLHPQHELEFKHSAAIVAFNHRFNMCVSADRDVVFWLPDRGI